jgi:hypothetical protein
LPYLARIPGGFQWVKAYIDSGIAGFLLIQLLNAMTWAAILLFSRSYKRPILLLFPIILGFGFSAKWHYLNDLSSDPQASLAFIFIPVHSLLYVTIGGVIGLVIDRYLNRNERE